jgi:nucleoside-diphosphate-sugar epimerase
MRIFVTGASGFVGGHVVEKLVGGHQIVALARSERSREAVQKLGAQAAPGELGAVPVESLRGCDVVVHCAAYAEEWGTREQFWQANVTGTEQLLEAARAAGVKRFVHMGTEAALFDGHELVDIDETTPYPARQRFLYSETKAEAERRVLAANADGFATLSVRPRLVWGPRDASVGKAIAAAAAAGRFAWIDRGKARTSTTHVYNVAHAVGLALEHGRGGQAYFVADDGERSLREFLSAYLGAQGVSLGERNVPSALARPLAALIEGLWRLFGVQRAPPMTRFSIAMMARSITVRTAKAQQELGYRPVISVDEGLAQLARASAART